MVHIICLKHANEGMVRFQWCSGAHFYGVLADEATASLGRNCPPLKLYAVVVQLVEPLPSEQAVASSSLVYRSNISK